MTEVELFDLYCNTWNYLTVSKQGIVLNRVIRVW